MGLNRPVVIIGALLAVTATRPAAAQEGGLAGVGVASGISAGMSAQSGLGITAGQATKGMRRPSNSGNANDLIDAAGNLSAGGPGGAAPGGGGAVGAAAGGGGGSAGTGGPIHWSNETGQDFLNELLRGGRYVRTVRVSTKKGSRRPARLTASQRRLQARRRVTRRALPGWIAHYLPDDRYKITSQLWAFVSTETDHYYYRAWAPGVLRQSRDHVIGFHSWQAAMLAGYRPDPVSKPAPGAQFAYLASLTRGPHLTKLIEYAYAGQVNPDEFDGIVKYANDVAQLINRRKDLRPLMSSTIDQVLGASIGEGDFPTSVGVAAAPPSAPIGPNVPGMTPAGAPAGGPGGPPRPIAANTEQPMGTGDKRDNEFNSFSNRAGSLAATNKR